MRKIILAVDDDKNILHCLERSFKNKPYDFISFDSPIPALLSLKKIRPHVIISDNRMPHILGVDFLSRAKSMNQRSLRILLTGYSYDCENNAHIDKVMQKPWQSDELEFEIASTTVHHDRIIVTIPPQSRDEDSRKCSLCGSDSVTHEVRYDTFTECLCEECHLKLDSFTGSYLEPMIMRQMLGNVL